VKGRNVPGISLFLLYLAIPMRLCAQDDDFSNQFRFNISTHHDIATNLTGFVHLDYFNNPDLGEQTFRVGWPGLTYTANHWLQLSGGLLTSYNDNNDSSDTLELRPYAGVKLFVPNDCKIHLYNYTRYEFRDTEDLDTHVWTGIHRIRSRFGVEVPLSSLERAWKPRTWYVLADVEPFYRFDKDTFDPLRVRGGAGYVINSRLSCELIYGAQFTRSNSGSLDFSENIIFLNIKIGLAEGILERLYNPD
jgi:Protein of unknown function (DUF2490)